MDASPTEPVEVARVWSLAGRCPVCGEYNGCRLETGEAYKGSCWCEGPTLSATALRRLQSELPEPRCLCRTCLEGIAANPEVTWDELANRRRGTAPRTPGVEDFYREGAAIVFTEQYHLRRGFCCGSGCRHCPYEEPQPGSASL